MNTETHRESCTAYLVPDEGETIVCIEAFDREWKFDLPVLADLIREVNERHKARLERNELRRQHDVQTVRIGALQIGNKDSLTQTKRSSFATEEGQVDIWLDVTADSVVHETDTDRGTETRRCLENHRIDGFTGTIFDRGYTRMLRVPQAVLDYLTREFDAELPGVFR